MDTTSDWFYTSIQQKRTLGMLASAFEITKSLEDLGLGSWESIEKGNHSIRIYLEIIAYLFQKSY